MNLSTKLYLRNNRFGIHNKSLFEYTYRYFQKKKYKQSARKDQTDGNSSKNNCAEVKAAGKNPDTYEQRSATDVNKFEQ